MKILWGLLLGVFLCLPFAVEADRETQCQIKEGKKSIRHFRCDPGSYVYGARVFDREPARDIPVVSLRCVELSVVCS